ncbi:MAG TPA: aminotransferase class III-fold pyridoxal phosphate-dependent enzyme [Nitriliruptorales bacterium]
MPRTAFLHPTTPPAESDFLNLVEGRGALVFDDSGRDYVDALASLWYCNIGHGRDEMADAIAAQARRLAGFHTFERYTNPPAEAICERIAELAPFPGARVFLTCSGSEAVETAVKLARITHSLAGDPDRTIVVSREPSYHGVTFAGTTLTGLPAFHEHIGPLVPDLVRVPKDDVEALGALFEQQGDRIAAVIAEPVVGAPGVYPPEPGYLEAVRALCDEHGALLILDEVICAFGRLGTWWGGQHYGVVADLCTFAKGVTSGYQPLGGVVVSRRVLDVLESAPGFSLKHGHTYSGHPTACAAALTNLDIIEREGLLDRSLHVAKRLGDGLDTLVDGERILEIRAAGAMFGVGLGVHVDAVDVREAMIERGVIARPIGGVTVAFCPPLIITDEQIDRCVDALGGAVEAVA